jgi:hypothetical protein
MLSIMTFTITALSYRVVQNAILLSVFMPSVITSLLVQYVSYGENNVL